MYGLVVVPLVPMRAEARESAEMVSQLLYGEIVEVIEEIDRWLKIKNLMDEYEAWVDKKMIFCSEILPSGEPYVLSEPFQLCYDYFTDENILLPGGSRIWNFDGMTGGVEGREVKLLHTSTPELELSADALVVVAKQFVNAPYLWGGKTIFGIDCSGLIQLIYSIVGAKLPRDASQQVACGREVMLNDAKAGDLAFFHNSEGRITHVGMMLDSSRILHASGIVKIEQIDSEGIISMETGLYTHQLSVVKRIF